MGLQDLFKRRKPAPGGDGKEQELQTEEVKAPDTAGTLADIEAALKAADLAKDQKARECGCGCWC